MSGAMLHGLGDCTPDLNCGCISGLNRALGIETPEEEIARHKAEVQRLKEEKLLWKRRALGAGWRGESA